MNIAVVSEDGKTVSRHFGKATQYVIIKTENGKILSREIRPKLDHLHSDCAKYKKCCCDCRNQSCEASVYDRHRSMIIDIFDCSVLLTGGMGLGVCDMLTSRGIKALLTDIKDIQEAVELYLSGNLSNFMKSVH